MYKKFIKLYKYPLTIMLKKLSIILAVIVSVFLIYIFLIKYSFDDINVGDNVDEVIVKLGKPSMKLQIGPEGVDQEVYYWFQVKGVEFTNEFPFMKKTYRNDRFFCVITNKKTITQKIDFDDIEKFMNNIYQSDESNR